MGSRIKACQLDPFADRTSCATMRANQPRFWFSSLAYVLIWALRRIGSCPRAWCRSAADLPCFFGPRLT